MKKYYSAVEILNFNIDGLPKTEQGMRLKAARDNWAFTEVAALGGKGGKRKEFTPPADILAAIRAKQATEILDTSTTDTLPALQNQLPAIQDQHLNTRQSQVEGARKGVLTAIERLIETTGCTKISAMQTLLTQAMLPEFAQIRQLFDLATDSRGKTGAFTMMD